MAPTILSFAATFTTHTAELQHVAKLSTSIWLATAAPPLRCQTGSIQMNEGPAFFHAGPKSVLTWL